ncbi:MAG TPA: helix-turn-helix domain-containing protein [Ilumatobacteraceae bacterium]|nr:helix-turn-helix domain-containing protein [Ilumatobacteraceae bacterium]
MVKEKVEKSVERGGLRGRRAVQAEETRAEILGAARRQFAAKGYSATSLKEIAAEAGVSVQTVYDSVGSKADLVRRLNDLVDAEARVGEIASTIPTESDPAVVAGIPARVTRRILERCSDIVRASFDGARAEPDLVYIADEGGRRHRAGARAVAERLAALHALDPSIDTPAAATTIATLADVRVALVLIDDHGFDLDAVETWIATTTARAILRTDAPAPTSRKRR